MQGRSDVEFLRSRLQRRGVRLAARVDGEPVVPEGAIDFIRHRRDLGRFFEQDQVDTVRTILDNGLQQGASVKQVMDALQTALPDAIGKARAENIARTEATTAFNQGRLEAFRETKGFVAAVEFMAITDARTTPICTERDGLVLAIDDPALPANTPPLHYMCRSVLSPVSEFELEDLGGKGYLDKQRDKLEKMPAPLKGFGGEPGLDGGRPPGQPPVVRTPSGPKGTGGGRGGSALPVTSRSIIQPESSQDSAPKDLFPGGRGSGYPTKPKKDELYSEHVRHGKHVVSVMNAWKGTREVETVEEAIIAINEQFVDFPAVRFLNELVTDPRSPVTGVGGRRRGYGDILLSRASDWSWATEDPLELARARIVLWHEIGHHVYNRHMTGPDFKEWLEAQPEPLPPGSGRAEQFAEQFAAEISEPTDTPLGRFFRRFRR